MDRDLVLVLVCDFAERITQPIRKGNIISGVCVFCTTLCHQSLNQPTETKGQSRNHFSTAVFFITEVITYRNYSKLSEMNGNYEV